jgi:hypothetical protein
VGRGGEWRPAGLVGNGGGGEVEGKVEEAGRLKATTKEGHDHSDDGNDDDDDGNDDDEDDGNDDDDDDDDDGYDDDDDDDNDDDNDDHEDGSGGGHGAGQEGDIQMVNDDRRR